MPKPRGGRKRKRPRAFTFSAFAVTLRWVSKRKPPLEVVRVVRSKAVDDASTSLREAAERARRAAEEARVAEERAAHTRAHERAAVHAEGAELSRGASARDFAQLAAFEVGAERRVADATARAAERAAVARDAHAHEDRARAELTEARASLDVVERHQRDAAQKQARQDDARVDEAAEEAFAARFGRRA